MKIVSIASIAIAALSPAIAIAQAANTASLAQEGAYEQTLCFGGPAHVISASDTDRYGTYQLTGGTQSTNKAFDSMSLECVGAFEIRSNIYRHKGYCVFQDSSGDKFHVTDSASPQAYTAELLGGTGKFKGITGSATVERLGTITPVRQGTLQGCRRISGNYKLP